MRNRCTERLNLSPVASPTARPLPSEILTFPRGIHRALAVPVRPPYVQRSTLHGTGPLIFDASLSFKEN